LCKILADGTSEWVSGTGVSSITLDEWKVVAHEVSILLCSIEAYINNLSKQNFFALFDFYRSDMDLVQFTIVQLSYALVQAIAPAVH
jgi:hypothetical protein